MGNHPGARRYSPVPLVVTSTLANGTPATAVPIVDDRWRSPTRAWRPWTRSAITFSLTNSTGTAGLRARRPYGNGLKTAWVQFLNLRHGGSGFMFGFGTGAVGPELGVECRHGSVTSTPPTIGTPPQILPMTNSVFGTGIPAERPFHSLSYPDIDYTMMRPAALPPSPYTNPVVNAVARTVTRRPTAPSTTYLRGRPGREEPDAVPGLSLGDLSGDANRRHGRRRRSHALDGGRRRGPVHTSRSVSAGHPGAAAVPGAGCDRRCRRLTTTIASFPPPTLAGAMPGTALTLPTAGASNASSAGDPYINNMARSSRPAYTAVDELARTTAPGAVPPWLTPITNPVQPRSGAVFRDADG